MRTPTVVILTVLVLVLGGCKTPKTTEGAPPLQSEREYAEQNEAAAQQLVKSGQASSIQEARAQVAAAANQQWARAAKAAQQKQADANVAKELDKMKRDGK